MLDAFKRYVNDVILDSELLDHIPATAEHVDRMWKDIHRAKDAHEVVDAVFQCFERYGDTEWITDLPADFISNPR